jgi:hypothetical protein
LVSSISKLLTEREKSATFNSPALAKGEINIRATAKEIILNIRVAIIRPPPERGPY